ncbi:MAG: DNA polymerase III subunit gamma/tau [Bdellovibrionales bacterium]
MSYQVIARKWRPKDFSTVIGQSHVSQTLMNALQSGRLPHALLFTGPRGTGKTSSARILAKALRCPNAENFVPCGACSECEEIASGSSVNVIEIDGASNNGVEAIRELRDSVGYMPSSGKYKVYIIDEVHMLSTSAFNALLKTLEEPPDHVIFVMATTEVHKIPNTILSRCQRFDFRKISLKLVTEHLRTICEADGVTADNEALWVIARQGEGSMRDAQSLLDQVITFSGKDISMEKVVDVLGLTDRSLLVETVQALVDRDVEKVVDVIGNIFQSGYDPKIYLQDLLEELRHLVLIKICKGATEGVVDLPDGEIQRLQKIGEKLSQEDIHMLFDMALKGGSDLPRSQDTRVVLEMLLLRMAQAPRIQELRDFAGSVTSATAVKPQAPVAKAAKKTSPPAENIEKQPAIAKKLAAPKEAPQNSEAPAKRPCGPIEDQWHDLVEKVKRMNGLMGAQLENTFVAELSEGSITVGVPDKVLFLYEKLNNDDNKKKLANYLKTFWGQDYSVNVVLGQAHAVEKKAVQTPKKLSEKKVAAHNQAVREQVENHPMIQKIQSSFSTEIKSIKET